jgi:hypothetical protein
VSAWLVPCEDDGSESASASDGPWRIRPVDGSLVVHSIRAPVVRGVASGPVVNPGGWLSRTRNERSAALSVSFDSAAWPRVSTTTRTRWTPAGRGGSTRWISTLSDAATAVSPTAAVTPSTSSVQRVTGAGTPASSRTRNATTTWDVSRAGFGVTDGIVGARFG